nr:hypothetical protein [Tanacetum cinerariifolium]
MTMNKKLKNKRAQEQVLIEKDSGNKRQKIKRWSACLDRKFIDIVVQLGGSQEMYKKQKLKNQTTKEQLQTEKESRRKTQTRASPRPAIVFLSNMKFTGYRMLIQHEVDEAKEKKEKTFQFD